MVFARTTTWQRLERERAVRHQQWLCDRELLMAANRGDDPCEEVWRVSTRVTRNLAAKLNVQSSGDG